MTLGYTSFQALSAIFGPLVAIFGPLVAIFDSSGSGVPQADGSYDI